MSYYDSSAWQSANGPSSTWDTRSQLPAESAGAFTSQLDEVDRALENLIKSGKFFPTRRDGIPLMSPNLPPHGHTNPLDPRMPQPVSRSAFNGMNSDSELLRSQSSMATLNGYYANQRFQQAPAPQTVQRQTDSEQVMQMKRRLAAARERELRNFHQEQQFNRSMSPDTTRKVFQQLSPTGTIGDMPSFGAINGGMSKERVMSPSALSEEDRREFLNRQNRGFYSGINSDSPVSVDEQIALRSAGHTPSISSEPRLSPRLSFDFFQQQNGQGQPKSSKMSNAAGNAQSTSMSSNANVNVTAVPYGARNSESNSPVGRSRNNSNGTSSPSSRSANFSLFDSATTQQSNTSASSPEHSPPRVPLVRSNTTSAVAPIGTRPIGSTTSSSASVSGAIGTRTIGSAFGLGAESDPFNHHSGSNNNNSIINHVPERTSSAASNPSIIGENSHSSIVGSGMNGGSYPTLNGNSVSNSSASSSNSNSANAMAWSSKVWGNKGLGMAASVWG
ncbi:hypothetical protein V1511DRAFT_486088 [Dipodascopsis uninucleata]